MKMIKLNFKALTNKEFLQYINLLIGIADAADPVKSKFKAERDALDTIRVRLTKALSAEEASLLTKTIEALDLRRDIAVSGFIAWVRSYRNFTNKIKRDAALLLDNYFKSLGKDISGMNYQAETSTLTKMVGDLKTDVSYKKATTDLGTDSNDWIIEIDNANLTFQTTYQQRSSELGLAITEETFYSIRPEAIEAIENLWQMISSRQTTLKADKGDTTLLDKALRDFEATFVQYKQLIKATLKRKKEESENPKPNEGK